MSNDHIQTITTVEDMPRVARSIVADYCDLNRVDETDISPCIWNDIITELFFALFEPCHKLLKINGTIYNEYDRAAVFYVYSNIYKRLCNSHNQEISLKGFLDMTGIDKQTIYNWNDDKYIYINGTVLKKDNVNIQNGVNSSMLLSAQRFDFHKIIMQDNEESLFALMKDRRIHQMKILPKLNKVHGWNMPGTSRERDSQKALGVAELPKLGQIAQIETDQ